ncbi:MAG: ribosome maturation factor RimM [Clostridia bacterium]
MQTIELGKIVRPQGIKGEVKIELYTNSFEFLRKNEQFVLLNSEKTLTLMKYRVNDNFCIAEFSEIQSRNEANELIGQIICMDKLKYSSSLSQDEFIISDVMDFDIVTNLNKNYGKLTSIDNYGSTDVYSFITKDNLVGRFANVPSLIIDIDYSKREIIVDDKHFNEVVCYED